MSDPTLLPATRLAAMIRARELSPVELVDSSLARIEAVQAVNNPFALILAEEARAAAREAERAIMRGDPLGPLHGLPVFAKTFLWPRSTDAVADVRKESRVAYVEPSQVEALPRRMLLEICRIPCFPRLACSNGFLMTCS